MLMHVAYTYVRTYVRSSAVRAATRSYDFHDGGQECGFSNVNRRWANNQQSIRTFVKNPHMYSEHVSDLHERKD